MIFSSANLNKTTKRIQRFNALIEDFYNAKERNERQPDVQVSYKYIHEHCIFFETHYLYITC